MTAVLELAETVCLGLVQSISGNGAPGFDMVLVGGGVSTTAAAFASAISRGFLLCHFRQVLQGEWGPR